MNDEIKNISDIYARLHRKWRSQYGNPNGLLESHGRYENVIKYVYAFDKIYDHFTWLDRVTIMASSDPVAVCHLLRKFYACEITIVSDHPLLDRIGDFFREEYGANIVDANPLFQDVSDHFRDSDLVVFPEFEHFAPLNLIKYYTENKSTAVIHYIDRVNPNSTGDLVLSEEDLIEQCDFSRTIEYGRVKNINDKNIFYAIGVR